MLVIFISEKGASKNAIFCVRVVSDQLCNANGPPAHIERDELVTRLSFGEMVEFLKHLFYEKL